MTQDVRESEQARERRIVYRVVAGLFVLGYWPGLWLFCSPWRRLLAEIHFAKQAIAESGWMAKSHFFPESREPLSMLAPVAFVAIFYGLKLGLVRLLKDKLLAVLLYVLLAFVSATILYLKFEDWDNMHVTFLGNWLGTPVILLPVPTLTFVWDVCEPMTRRQLAIRTAVEIVVVIPVWMYCWVFLSLGAGLMWI